ncbi:MAG TPA: TolC family protein [Candidatus Binatia bacterium]|jgi:outer membrane protein TolC|nr:TolC family protein [Candidatus Binatia bacterium]
MMLCRARGWLVVLALTVAAPAVAEGPAPAPPSPFRFSVLSEQWQTQLARDPALDVPSAITRDHEVQRVTLKETIAIALENNPGIAARRLEPTRVQQDVLEAQGQYDPVAAADLLYSKVVTPNPNALSGVNTSDISTTSGNVYLRKLLRTGARLDVDFLNERLDNNAQFIELRPQYTPQLGLSLVQPLLRDFGWDFSYLVVRVAERTADAAYYQYEADLTDFVVQVIIAYWAVVGRREAVEVRREAMVLAERTVSENQARVDVGLLPPVSVLEAQADAKSREEQLLVAQNDLTIARQRLAQLAFFRPQGSFVPRSLEPVEDADREDVQPEVDDSLALALVDRPEIAASAKGVEVRQLNERITGNQLLPRVDLVGGYGLNGLSGRTESFISERNLGGCTFISQDVWQCPNSRFGGPKSEAYHRLYSGDFESYNFGIQVEVPIDNATARARNTRSKIELNQAELNHRQLLSDVTLEVRQTVSDVLTSRQRIDTSRVARELADQNLRNQEKRHEVGMATTKDLLDFQTRLTEARAAEVQSQIDHAISLARWRRAEGQLLDHFQIVIDRPGVTATPWFAWF